MKLYEGLLTMVMQNEEDRSRVLFSNVFHNKNYSSRIVWSLTPF